MIEGEESGALIPAAELREARHRLSLARGKAKLDFLFSAPDPLTLVRSLPEQEIFLAILEIGLDDAAEVISLCSLDQFRHFIDRSGWPRPEQGPETRQLLHWLTLAREGAATSDEALERYREKLAGLDVELLELVLREKLRIHDLDADPDPIVADAGRTWRTPEGRYLVEFAADGADYATLRQLLDDLFAQDALGSTRLLEAVRWEFPSELSETARRWRDGRLRDLGFPGIEEAISFFARPARRTSAALADGPAGSALIRSSPSPSFLDAALARVDAAAIDRVEQGVVYAANAVLVANHVPADDAVGAREALEDTRATLSVGLEVLAGADEERAARILSDRPIKEVFQAGMGEIYSLQSHARASATAARLPGASVATILGPPWDRVIDALAQQRPALPDDRRPSRARAPATRAEIASIHSLLDEAEAVPRLLAEMGLTLEAIARLADAAGFAPTAVRAADVVQARARAALRGAEGVSFSDPQNDTPYQFGTPAAIESKARELLDEAARRVGSPAAARAAERLAGSRR